MARDRLMTRLSARYPSYGFEQNKGYWSEEHIAAITTLGPTPEHRITFNTRSIAEPAVTAPLPRRTSRPPWRELPAAAMAAHLVKTPTISDRTWTDEPRLPRESRTAFIHRILLGHTEAVEAPEDETDATTKASGETLFEA